MGRKSFQKIKQDNILWLSADFETTLPRLDEPYYKKKYDTYAELIKNEVNFDKPRVYSWAIGGKKEEIENSYTFKAKKWNDIFVRYIEYNDEYCAWVGVSIISFMHFITNCLMEQTRIYFHNLKGFDGHYILGALNSYNFDMVRPRNWWNQYKGLTLSDEEKSGGR